MQFLYVQKFIPDFLKKLHKDDKGGIIVRMTDSPGLEFPQALLVLRTGHTDDESVQFFAEKMKDKMAKSRDKDRVGWDQPSHGVGVRIANMFRDHLTKRNDGNYLDLACLLMMLHQRGDQPDLIAGALEPTVDFTQDLVLDSVPRIGEVHACPIRVEFDGGDTYNGMWIHQDDDAIKINDPTDAIHIANHLLAWAHAEQKKTLKEKDVE